MKTNLLKVQIAKDCTTSYKRRRNRYNAFMKKHKINGKTLTFENMFYLAKLKGISNILSKY